MPTISADSALETSLRQEAITLLQGLLRLDTQTPPGNERLAADWIAGVLEREGIPFDIVEAAPTRATIVSRLQAANPTGRPVMMMGHTDVVNVEPEKWDRDPFCGDIVDDFVYGRGALDMKGQVAANLTVFLAIKRADLPLTRDVIFCAFADEEEGGKFGAEWVWNNHRALIDAEFAINEGGGEPITIADTEFIGCQVAEKGSARLKMTATGKPGHASVPLPETAFRNLGIALGRLHAWEPPTVIVKPIRVMLENIATVLGGEPQALIGEALASDPPSWEPLSKLPLTDDERRSLYARTRNTVVPTMIHGGARINVIPSEIVVDVDGRTLPGEDPGAFRDAVQAVVGDAATIELVIPATGTAADVESPFYDAIEATLARIAPDAHLMPVMSAGGTDAPLIPGVKVYGFFPFPPSDRLALYEPMVHGHNERVHVDDLAYATRFIHDLIATFVTS
ncbi:MAG: M20/M25/M40 family metallo-hydrolase [Chloroflexota bacterium]|nr:M20/M25/M40 family metallo-hydrolase [Chloroflexota bacterium]